VNIIEAMEDEKLFARHFAGQTWDAWRVFLAALFALPMNADQLALFRQCTDRHEAPSEAASEAWVTSDAGAASRASSPSLRST
jgi:hypothetical protein